MWLSYSIRPTRPTVRPPSFYVCVIQHRFPASPTISVAVDGGAVVAIPLPPSSLSAASVIAAASGGSSPSREVQEILSLKDSDCLNEFYDDPSDQLDDDGDDDLTDIESLENNKKRTAEESYNFNETCCKNS